MCDECLILTLQYLHVHTVLAGVTLQLKQIAVNDALHKNLWLS